MALSKEQQRVNESKFVVDKCKVAGGMMEGKSLPTSDVGGSHRFGLKSANNMARLMDGVDGKHGH